MGRQLKDLTKPECVRYRSGCNFTLSEAAVFDMRTQGHSILYVAQHLHMSESGVNRIIRAIKRKIRRYDYLAP